MTALLQAGAVVCTVLGLVSGAAVLLARRDVRVAGAVLVPFLLAGGLLRLGAGASWRVVLVAAVLVGLHGLVVVRPGRPDRTG